MLLAVCCSIIHAQNLGISSTGSSPNVSAGLDVDFSNKGVLIPRVALTSLTDAVTIPTPATSLLVYSKAGAVTDGYYYNSGTAAAPTWTAFMTSSNGCFGNWQLFTANGTFIVPAGISRIKVCVYGGGAGGNGNYISTAGGGGGGAGGYAEGIYTVSPLASYAVTVGSGGTGGVGNAFGIDGNNSSFGALISASGGTVGTLQYYSGIGGWGSGGYINTTLGNGGAGGYSTYTSNNGTGGGGSGGTPITGGAGGGGGGGFGGGNGGSGIGSGFNAQPNSGAGGGGAGTGGTPSGGNGAAGKVIVFW